MLPVPQNCRDGMGVAFWRRPEAYLDPEAVGQLVTSRAGFEGSGTGTGTTRPRPANGAWARHYGQLLELDEFDCGLRLVLGQGP